MSDNIFTAVLTFSLLAGGTAAIGSEMFGTAPGADAGRRHAQVTVTASAGAGRDRDDAAGDDHRARADRRVVTMPMVVVTGQREAVTVAVETRASETPRVQ